MLFLLDPFCSTLGTVPSNVILLGQLPLTSFVDEAVPLTSRVLLTCQLVLHFDTLFLCMRAHANAQGTDLRTGLLSVCLDCLLDATSSSYSVPLVHPYLVTLTRAKRAKEQ